MSERIGQGGRRRAVRVRWPCSHRAGAAGGRARRHNRAPMAATVELTDDEKAAMAALL